MLGSLLLHVHTRRESRICPGPPVRRTTHASDDACYPFHKHIEVIIVCVESDVNPFSTWANDYTRVVAGGLAYSSRQSLDLAMDARQRARRRSPIAIRA